MRVTSEIVLKGDLAATLTSLLGVNECITAESEVRAVYNAGFRAALNAVAEAYSLNVYEVRESEALFQRAIRQHTVHDKRL